MKIGYAAGVWDLFHIGHLRLLKNAEKLCDKLIVGVSTDELTLKTKGRLPVIPYDQRREIIAGLGYATILQDSLDKIVAKNKIKFDVVFVGDDHFDTEPWRKYEDKMEVIYLPYTKKVSTTKLLKRIRDRV